MIRSSTRKGRAMAHILLVAALTVSFAVPAVAAKRHYNRGSPDDCRIVNIAPSYAKTTIRKGKRVYITRPTAAQDMAIICKPEAAW
jgi:hypothetical protein